MKELLIFESVLKERIWGSERWTVSAHPSGDLKVSEGTYKGMTLSQLFGEHRELFGKVGGDRFPLLVKVIEAKADLSVQVHPGDAYAKEHENGSLGKSECWYIMDPTDKGRLVLGHTAESIDEAKALIDEGRWDDFLKRIRVKRGNFIQIDPGTIHSICGGVSLTEIQQNSDITYRLYDYDRTVDGKKRELHLSQSLDVINIPDQSRKNVFDAVPSDGYRTPFYTIRKEEIRGERVYEQKDTFQIVTVTDGEGSVDGRRVFGGDSLIVPDGYGTYGITGNVGILITTPSMQYNM